jgi:predicted Rossmann fold flavoprotein
LKHLVVIGGGAAGFFCAINAAQQSTGLRVTILEKSNKVLSKVKVSGGGRCNVTHACFDIGEMCKRYPRGQHFVKKAFHQFFTTDTINWFKKRGVELKAEADGRMFPVTNSSQTIIDCLLQEAAKYEVEVKMKSEVRRVAQVLNQEPKDSSRFAIELTDDTTIHADYVCIATGGYPKASLFNWLKDTGHSIEEPVPSLFTFNLPKHPITALMGVVAADVKIKIAGTKFEQQGPLLITHWGLSGPAVLKLSAYAAVALSKKQWQFTVIINWLPAYTEQSLKDLFQLQRNDAASQKVLGKNTMGLPARLWEFLAMQAGVTETMRWADLPAAVLNKWVKNICTYECLVNGKTTFKEEFVTAGGIVLSEIDANTMMSRKVPNLFFAGEVIDVDGITGGYNFQHAWTSGWVAAKSIVEKIIN